MPQFNKKKLKVVNVEPVELGNTRISIDYAQKSPRTVFWNTNFPYIRKAFGAKRSSSQMNRCRFRPSYKLPD